MYFAHINESKIGRCIRDKIVLKCVNKSFLFFHMLHSNSTEIENIQKYRDRHA